MNSISTLVSEFTMIPMLEPTDLIPKPTDLLPKSPSNKTRNHPTNTDKKVLQTFRPMEEASPPIEEPLKQEDPGQASISLPQDVNVF